MNRDQLLAEATCRAEFLRIKLVDASDGVGRVRPRGAMLIAKWITKANPSDEHRAERFIGEFTPYRRDGALHQLLIEVVERMRAEDESMNETTDERSSVG